MIRKIFHIVPRYLPISWIGWLSHQQGSIAQSIVHDGVRNRKFIIPEGVGAGLKFNPYDYNPDCALGTYEYPVQKAFAQYLKPGDVFYDIGANVGFFTVIGAHLVGVNGHVYSFEPAPKNAVKLRKNIVSNELNNITVFEKAVSSSAGKGELYMGEYVGAYSINHLPPKLKETIVVELVSIDHIIAEEKLAPPDVIKIDVEGSELDVLHGMPQTIKKFKPVIICEIDDRDEEFLIYKRDKIYEYIKSFGYEIKQLEDSYPGNEWSDVLHFVAIPE